MTLPADACVVAIGQKADLSFLRGDEGVSLQPNGTIRVDPLTLQTGAPDIFAGGDVAFGPRNLIEAVANGKRAARSIHEFLAQATTRVEAHLDIEAIPTRLYRRITGFEVLDRQAPPTLPVDRRTGIAEVENGYGAEAARQQAARCLVCHVQTIYDPEKCVLCNRCVDVCPEHCLAIVPFDDLELPQDQRALLRDRALPPERGSHMPLAAMVKDDERCIRCGLCAIRCPTEAMTMERFSIVERFAAAPPAAADAARPVPSEEYV
jgi:NAD-dependent dihydropyrimidine dehydrogenase PreA subunit